MDATQKGTAIDQQHSYKTLICQRHQTILRLLSSAATASTRWQVRELNCPTTYHLYSNVAILFFLSSPSMTERKKQKFRKEEVKRMFLLITNKTVSFTSCPFVSYVDMCCFQDIKQLLDLAVITNVSIIIFA